MKLSILEAKEYLHQTLNDNLDLLIANKPQKSVELVAFYGRSINQYKVWARLTQGEKVEILEIMTDENKSLYFDRAEDIFSFVRNELDLSVSVLFITYE